MQGEGELMAPRRGVWELWDIYIFFRGGEDDAVDDV